MLLAAAQFFATPFDLARNLETAARLVRQAAENGAEVVVLPELFNIGYAYTPRLLAAAETRSGETVRLLAGLSAELGVVAAGSLLLREGAQTFNALVVANPNGRLGVYCQRHCCLWERGYAQPGDAPVIVETRVGRLGLLVGWDATQPAAWGGYAGKVDAVLVASTAPRFHRAVLNFPLGRRLYVGQLVPALVAQRDTLDDVFAGPIAAQAARLGVPVAHAAMSGRFVTTLPFPRLSFFIAALNQPRYWPLARQAHLASLRATFYGRSAIVGADGQAAAVVDGDEGIALAEVGLRPGPGARLPSAPAPLVLPPTVRLLARVLAPLAAREYRRQQAPLPH